MLIDGEKYACISCIKGHRVSGCLHNDRELHHINPKGRPVKQCEHCRGARKSKSHHAKCDCGDKKDKLKDKGDAKDNENRCCCHTTGKCICGIKKEPLELDLKLDTGKQTLHSARAKPKLMTAQSENTLMVFANGHHRPCHRNNNTAHVSGAPYSYKNNRPHTLHGHAAFSAFTQGTTNPPSDPTSARALDTHSLSNDDFRTYISSGQRLNNGLQTTPLAGSLDTSDFQDPLFTSQSTVFGQDSHSPTDSPLGDALSNQQWPWYGNIAPINRNLAFGSLSTSPSQDCLPYLDNEWAIPSAGLNTPTYWSAGDLPLDPAKLSSLTQPPSNPGLTTTGSSSQSEIGDSILLGDLELSRSAQSSPEDTSIPRAPQSTVSDTLFWEDSPAFQPAPSLSSDVRSLPVSVPPSTASTDIPTPDFDFNAGFLMQPSGPNSTSPPADDLAMSYPDISFDKSIFASNDGAIELGAIAMPNDVENDNWISDFDFSFKPGFPMEGYQ